MTGRYRRYPPEMPRPIRFVERLICRVFGHRPIDPASLPICGRCYERLPKE